MEELKNKLNKIINEINYKVEDIDINIFYDLNNLLIDSNIPDTYKEELVSLFIEISRVIYNFDSIKDLLPSKLINILISFDKYRYLKIESETLENINEKAIPNIYQKIVREYYSFLQDNRNIDFIIYLKNYIDNFNNYLLEYLKRIDMNNEEFIKSIDKETLDLLKDITGNINLIKQS